MMSRGRPDGLQLLNFNEKIFSVAPNVNFHHNGKPGFFTFSCIMQYPRSIIKMKYVECFSTSLTQSTKECYTHTHSLTFICHTIWPSDSLSTRKSTCVRPPQLCPVTSLHYFNDSVSVSINYLAIFDFNMHHLLIIDCSSPARNFNFLFFSITEIHWLPKTVCASKVNSPIFLLISGWDFILATTITTVSNEALSGRGSYWKYTVGRFLWGEKPIGTLLSNSISMRRASAAVIPFRLGGDLVYCQSNPRIDLFGHLRISLSTLWTFVSNFNREFSIDDCFADSPAVDSGILIISDGQLSMFVVAKS